MDEPITQVRVDYLKVEGLHTFRSPVLPGLLIADGDFDRAVRDVLIAVMVLVGQHHSLPPSAQWQWSDGPPSVQPPDGYASWIVEAQSEVLSRS